jgi:hypothetical protein
MQPHVRRREGGREGNNPHGVKEGAASNAERLEV